MYLVSTPWWLRALYPALTWQIPTKEQCLYLTFDDGPHPTATPFVLDKLNQFNAKASFFCIGKNVEAYQEIYNRIIAEGHSVGNHTQHHLNGWETKDMDYLENIQFAASNIHTPFFRPPYGRIKRSQIKQLHHSSSLPSKIIMWSVLSGDFDMGISPEKCFQNVLKHTKPGSIIVFHDSTKAWDRMQYALPMALEYFSQKGYQFKAL
ncbi:polysaccharide deacetylase family protein [Parasediminibacterium sp. JCM 36343]|uniref:polysaccharide deacetylase family protein n=1 Tax=Parasediminibacterium sp. JCM 36343 TaxID=3374279 RepID=UPI00397E1C23